MGNKDVDIYLCHQSAAIRLQISTTLRESGFKQVTGVGEVADIIALLGDGSTVGGKASWVITTLQADGKANALQLGKLLQKEEVLRNFTWSLLVTNEEFYTLPLAIENSLLSWHLAENFSQGTSIKSELDRLQDIAERTDFKFEMMALCYAREFLKQTGNYENMLKLTTAQVELQPENTFFLSHLADALALNNQAEEAKKLCWQILWLDKSRQTFINGIVDREGQSLFSNTETEALSRNEPQTLDLFGIKRCIIVEPDETVRSHLRKAFETLGVSDFLEFDNGLAAWESIQTNHANTIVVTEWKLPKLSGMALLQRIHQAGLHDMPVIVSSALLGPEDRGLLEELGNAELLPKPLTMESLEQCIRSAIREETMPSSFKGIVRKVRTMLKKNDIEQALGIWDSAAKNTVIPELWRHLIASEILLAQGQIEDSYAEAMTAAKLGAKGAYFYNHLGKIAFAIGDFDSSSDHFQKANAEVSINVERLTELTAVELHRGDIEKAETASAEASAVDATNPKSIEAKAMVALEKGDGKGASSAMSQLDDLMNIVAHLNNRAVAMAWKGEHEKGIALYREALVAAPRNKTSGQKFFTPFVLYNLALALARSGDLSGAEKTASSLDPLELSGLDARLSLKVSAFLQRARAAIKSGKNLEIDTPKTSDLTKKRIQKAQAKAEKLADSAERIIKDLKIFGAIDYRALKLVEKNLKLGDSKKN